MGPFVVNTRLLFVCMLFLGVMVWGGVIWDFDDAATPEGASLRLIEGKPAFTRVDGGQGLAPGVGLAWADAGVLRLRPELELHCRFRLDALRETTQNLALKDGEYLLRVDWQKEGGHLSFFVHLEGKWEPRLRGPVVKPGVWYDVHAQWTGTALRLNVNGELYTRQRSGPIREGDAPLETGPVTGVIDRLGLWNPSYDRSALLWAFDAKAAQAVRQPTQEFGGESGWDDWEALGGARCETEDGVLSASFPSASTMLVSPPLVCELSPLPFICIDVDASGGGWSGHLDVVTDSGVGTIPFQPMANGRTTLVAGTITDAWMGTLRRLALSFSGGKGPVRIRRLVLSDRPVGTPWLLVRDFAPGRAVLRSGRVETVIAGIKNLGGEVEECSARLEVPPGVAIISDSDQVIPYLGRDDFDLVRWRIRASKPGTFTVRAVVSAPGAASVSEDLGLVFKPLPAISRTDYVPVPRPARSDTINLMHYCALWKEGTHYGWQLIEPWPGRRPAIGWYDEGTPEVADWHIKYALEHGISGFIYCWYRAHLEPDIEHKLGHAIHDGLFRARYRDMFTFCIMWENGCAEGVKNEADLLENLLPFWIDTYFTHPSYLKLDNRPVLFVWQPRRLIPQLGGTAGTRAAFEKMRGQCRAAGFSGLRIIACMNAAEEELGKQIEESGWDAVSGYAVRPAGIRDAGIDPEGMVYREHAEVLRRYRETWVERDRSTGSVPDIPNVMMGWDPRPWGRGHQTGYIANPCAEPFEAACRDAKALAAAKPADRWDRSLVVFDNWTEFGEGHYIEPTSGLGFSFLNALKRVFCATWPPEELTDIVPEDIGLQPPQKRYEQVRADFGSRLPWQPLRIRGDLIAHWQFETERDGHFLDSSRNNCRLKAEGVSVDADRGGRVLRCGNGGAVCPAPEPFFHPGGISLAVWCKPSEAGQSDRWLINTVLGSRSGYRLGLAGGRPTWQVPREHWSHGLTGPDPLPLGQWSHLAATFDNRTMRLFVNGAEVGSLDRRGFISPGRQVVVGGFSVSLDRARFRGWVDEVRIYRRVLDGTEIAELARGTSTGP